MAKVSIIMPCLNAVKYIKTCIDSVVCQTLPDIEILIIDAGSMDGTLDILAEYEKKDSRIYIIHSDIKSYGYQMNLGISLAAGEYIGIVEIDDIVEPDMFEVLYLEAVSESADYVKGTSEGFFRAPSGIEWRFPILSCPDLGDKSIIIPGKTPEIFLYDHFLWNGIYRRNFFKKIRFNETSGAAFQDIGALFQILSNAKKGVYLNHHVYNYRQDNSGASSYNEKSFLYTAAEYRYIEQFLPALSSEWENAYYLNMAGHSIDRFIFMAGSGHYWSESEAGIIELQKKLSSAIQEGKIRPENCPYFEKLLMFLKSPYYIYEVLRDEYCAKLKSLYSILKAVRNRRVYIFGAGQYGKFLHIFLALNSVEVAAFCDNSAEKKHEIMQTLPILAPEETISGNDDVCYVITAKSYVQEITDQLLYLGVDQRRIAFYDAGIDVHLLKEFQKEDYINKKTL